MVVKGKRFQAALAAFAVPRLSWRYISIGDVTRVVSAVTVANGVMLLIRLAGPLVSPPPRADHSDPSHFAMLLAGTWPAM